MPLSLSMLGALAICGLGGMVRGATGFGGAMVMTPVLSVLLSPITAVIGALLLETFAAAPMLRDAARKALILARKLGYRLGMDDVGIEPLYPASMDGLSVD